MREQFRPVRINFAPVDVTGGPGLAVVAVIVAIAFEFPETRWLLLAGIVSGALLAAAMILARRRSRVEPSMRGPGSFFEHLPPSADIGEPGRDRTPDSSDRRVTVAPLWALCASQPSR
jgi:hypothetical protein